MSYGQYSQNPYHQGPAQEQGHGYPQSNPYPVDNQNAPNQYEMQNYGNYGGGNQGNQGNQNNYGNYGNTSNPYQQPQQAAAAGPIIMSSQEFLDRVKSLREDIKSLTNDVDYIGQLHQRTLSSTDGSGRDQLEQYVSQTQIRNTAIKDGIKGLERDLARTTDGSRNTKNTQLQSLKTFFKSELDKYQSIERDYQHRYRDQIARQYRIVNPDASEDEVRQATEADWGNEGVFQTALRTNRTGHASSILGNVRARHNELQRIEQTLSELAILYQELATVVEQQDPVIQAAETNAQHTVENIEKGNEQVSQANKHARNTRKLKWWCLGITVLILAIIAIALGIVFGTRNN